MTLIPILLVGMLLGYLGGRWLFKHTVGKPR